MQWYVVSSFATVVLGTGVCLWLLRPTAGQQRLLAVQVITWALTGAYAANAAVAYAFGLSTWSVVAWSVTTVLGIAVALFCLWVRRKVRLLDARRAADEQLSAHMAAQPQRRAGEGGN